MALRFDGEVQQEKWKSGEAIWIGGGFLAGEAEQHRQVGQRSLFQLLLIKVQQVRQVLAGGPGGRKPGRWNALETKFGDGAGESARESGSVGDGREVAQLFGPLGGVDDASGNGFNPQAANGREVPASQGLRGEAGGELDERESVNALAAVGKRGDGQFVSGGAGGSDDQNFGLSGVV